MSQDIVVTAPNPTYNGRTLGVQFRDGQAIINEATVPAHLGRSPRQVVEEFARDFSDYRLAARGGRAFVMPAAPWKDETEDQASPPLSVDIAPAAPAAPAAKPKKARSKKAARDGN